MADLMSTVATALACPNCLDIVDLCKPTARLVAAEVRAEIADQLGRCAANARLNAERHAADTPERIGFIAEMRAYEWAARIAEGRQ